MFGSGDLMLFLNEGDTFHWEGLDVNIKTQVTGKTESDVDVSLPSVVEDRQEERFI